MPSLKIDFEVGDPGAIITPDQLLGSGGRYLIEVREGDLYVWGNAGGFRYLAEVFARLAVGGYTKGAHIHIPFDSRAWPPQVGAPGAAGEAILFAATEFDKAL